jgi:hypothetical protein
MTSNAGPSDAQGAVGTGALSLSAISDPGRGWAIFYGVVEIFAAFSVREAGRRADHLLG